MNKQEISTIVSSVVLTMLSSNLEVAKQKKKSILEYAKIQLPLEYYTNEAEIFSLQLQISVGAKTLGVDPKPFLDLDI